MTACRVRRMHVRQNIHASETNLEKQDMTARQTRCFDELRISLGRCDCLLRPASRRCCSGDMHREPKADEFRYWPAGLATVVHVDWGLVGRGLGPWYAYIYVCMVGIPNSCNIYAAHTCSFWVLRLGYFRIVVIGGTGVILDRRHALPLALLPLHVRLNWRACLDALVGCVLEWRRIAGCPGG